MFDSLFSNPFNQNQKSNSDLLHVILGTSIDTVPNEQEGEVLFGCGCFWGAEKGFWKLPGVITTAVGYAGGQTDQPSYDQVCRGITGHSEVVRVVWDKTLIDISDLLKMFWECHDPTQGNRQGNDTGTQYRSVIYITNDNDKEIALSSRDSYQKELIDNGYGEVTTEIKQNQKFYFAEHYHQQYLAKPGSRPYCSAMPTKICLTRFPGSNYKLKAEVWDHFDWDKQHCVLRSDNNRINL